MVDKTKKKTCKKVKKSVNKNVSMSNYMTFNLFEDEDLENDFPIEHWGNEDMNDILYGEI